MKRPTKTVRTALAVLLVANFAPIQGLNNQNVGPAQYTYKNVVATNAENRRTEYERQPLFGDSRLTTCHSDEIREYLLQNGVVSPSNEFEERLQAGSTPEVRVIYLVPSDRQPRSEAPIALANGIKHLQRWYSEQIPDGRTFKLHEPIVEIVQSSHETSWFFTNPASENPSLYLWSNSINEASARFFDPNYIYVIYVDVEAPGQSVGATSGVALLPQHDILGMSGQNAVEPSVCRWVGGLGHELGHALGLPHPPECDSHQSPDDSFNCQSLMYLGYIVYPSTHFLADNKDKLSQSPFIVPVQLIDPPFGCTSLLGDLSRPAISSADLNGTKKLTVSGLRFGGAPRVLINEVDRTGFITSVSDTRIRIKGKSKKLGLKSGDNTVQVFDAGGAASNVFILHL